MAYQPTESEIPRTHKTVSALFTDLFRDTTNLVRGEVRLAKAELSEKVAQVESGAVSFIAAYVLSFIGLLILLESAVIALANIVEPWLAALIVGAVVLIAGLITVGVARRKLAIRNMVPKATMEELRKDKEFIKEQTR